MRKVSVLGAALWFCVSFGAASADAHLTVRIFASDAVAQPIRQIGYLFERAHPNVKLDYEFAASGVFVGAIRQGVPPDIFISSSNKEMNRLISLSFINFPQTIAYDYFAAATRCTNPVNSPGSVRITESNLVREIGSPNVKLVVASPTLSPAGRHTFRMLGRMGADGAGSFAGIMSHTTEVIGPDRVLAKVMSGKADLGIVYASQIVAVKRMGECLNAIPIAKRYNRKVELSVAPLKTSQFHFVGRTRRRIDAEYARFLLSERAQRIFKDWGLVPVKNERTFFSRLF